MSSSAAARRKKERIASRRTADLEFCSVAEAAERLGVSVSTVWRWVDAGKVPAVRIGPKAIRIRRKDVEDAIQPRSRKVEVASMEHILTDINAACRPMTREERARGLAALAAAESFAKEILARRKGKLLPDSAAIIREEREKRSRRL